MTNIDALERFETSFATKIDKLFWIATSMQNEDFEDFINEMEDSDLKECFPEIYMSEKYKEYINDGDFLEALIDSNKLGLIACVLVPEYTDFSFKGSSKTPTSWITNEGICTIIYCYGETLEQLLSSIEEKSQNIFLESVKKSKKLNK